MAATEVFTTSPAGVTVTRGDIRYIAIAPGQLVSSITTETQVQRTMGSAGTFGQLTARVTANTLINALIFTFRKNGADGTQVVSFSAGTTGWLEETDTDSVSSGDEVCIEIEAVAGGSPQTATVAAVGIAFTASSNTVMLLGAASASAGISAASSTGYFAFFGSLAVNATEANAQARTKTAGTLKAMQVNVSANARTTDTTFRLRKNTANGTQLITVTSSQTGIFLDPESDTDSVSVDDLYNMSWTTSTGTGTLSVTVAAVELETTNGASMVGAHVQAGIAQAATDATTYKYPQGFLTTSSTTGTDNYVNTLLAHTASKLQIRITANTALGTTVVTFRKNNGAGNQSFDVLTLQTGWFDEDSATDSVAVGDDVNVEINTDGASGSITFTHVGYLHTVSGGPVSLSASASAVATASADLDMRRALSASAAAAATTTATVATVRALSVSVTGSSTASATIVEVAGGTTYELTANAAGVGAPTITAQVVRALVASAAGAGTASVTLREVHALSESAAGVATTTATLNRVTEIDANGAPEGVATVTVNMDVRRALSVSVTGQSTTSATMTVSGSVDLSVSVTAAGVATVNMDAAYARTTSAAGAAAASASLLAIRYRSAQADGLATTSANLDVVRAFGPSVAGSASVSVQLAVMRALSASAAGAAIAQATLEESAAETAIAGKYAAEHAFALALVRQAGA